MTKQLFFLIALCVTLLSSACFFDDDGGIFDCVKGEGPSETFELELDPFDGVKLSSSVDVFITQGPEQEVIVKGQENIVDLMELDVDDGIWEIEFRKCLRDHHEVEVFITIPDIALLNISGSGEIIGENTFSGDLIVLRISGSGDMDLALDHNEVDAKISGSGRMTMEGFAEFLDLHISGSGNFNGFGLETQKCDIKISGSGDAEVNVTDVLDVNITGSGDVHYLGNPIINVTITGSGEVKDAN